jgi:integrase
MVELLYGSGLRLNELLSLRIKDLDFHLKIITVRSGKGDKDRVTLLPTSLEPRLRQQIADVEKLHRRDIEDGYGEVYLPYALANKYPRAARESGWQFTYPIDELPLPVLPSASCAAPRTPQSWSRRPPPLATLAWQLPTNARWQA